jgi:uncharacterized cupredoxin-like copper-binding protein
MQFRSTRRQFMFSAAALSAGLAGVPALRAATAQDGDYPELLMVATDYDFEMPATAESGYLRLTIDNQGAEEHHAIFFRINDEATSEQFQEAMMSGDLGAILGVSTAYGGPNVGPGLSSSVIAYLDPGNYVVICVIPDPTGVPHAAHGMVAALEVTAGEAGGEAPETDGTISLVDMAFDGLPEEVAAGSYTWEVVNNGEQLHEILVLQLAEGLDLGDVMTMLTAEPGAATPEAGATPEGDAGHAGAPFEAIAGTAPMSPGAINYLEIDLEPGTYVAICFIPDVNTGMPHFLMGMIAEFQVS